MPWFLCTLKRALLSVMDTNNIRLEKLGLNIEGYYPAVDELSQCFQSAEIISSLKSSEILFDRRSLQTKYHPADQKLSNLFNHQLKDALTNLTHLKIRNYRGYRLGEGIFFRCFTKLGYT